MAREGRDVISVCCMKNDARNVVSDADGMKNIWRKYMEKLLNVENDWDGEVDCPEVMGPRCLISEEEVAPAIFHHATSTRKTPSKEEAVLCSFVDLDKAFDRVPNEVVRWALRKLGVDEWLICIVIALYTEACTVVRTDAGLRESS